MEASCAAAQKLSSQFFVGLVVLGGCCSEVSETLEEALYHTAIEGRVYAGIFSRFGMGSHRPVRTAGSIHKGLSKSIV